VKTSPSGDDPRIGFGSELLKSFVVLETPAVDVKKSGRGGFSSLLFNRSVQGKDTMNGAMLKNKFKCFHDFAASEMSSFLEFCELVCIPDGEVLWTEGSVDNYAAFILKGKIGIKKKSEFGGQHIVVGIYTEGSVVGELCLLTDKPRSVSAVALEATEMVVLHNHKFEEMIQNHPLVGLRLLKYIFLSTSQRLTKSYERIVSMF